MELEPVTRLLAMKVLVNAPYWNLYHQINNGMHSKEQYIETLNLIQSHFPASKTDIYNIPRTRIKQHYLIKSVVKRKITAARVLLTQCRKSQTNCNRVLSELQSWTNRNWERASFSLERIATEIYTAPLQFLYI